jgi:hypothetical protein
MYHIVEVVGSRFTVITEIDDLENARDRAYDHAARTGLAVEIQNELGRVIERFHIWRE